jgi:hypothetical protein
MQGKQCIMYHGINYCSHTLGVDNLLESYNNIKQTLTHLIFNDPATLVETLWKLNGPLPIDNHCVWGMGEHDKKTYMCASCKNIKRLQSDTNPIVGKETIIMCGNHIGETWIVHKHNEHRTTHYIESKEKLVLFYKKQCDKRATNYNQIITGDPFTMSTIISWGVQELFYRNNLPHIQASKNSFVCGGIGYSVDETPSIGNIFCLEHIADYTTTKKVFKKKIIVSILAQLLVSLKQLTKINAVHGNPSIKTILFSKSPATYTYEGFISDAPITLKLDNWERASLMTHGVVYTTNNFLRLDNSKVIQKIKTKILDGSQVYRMNDNTGHTHYNHLYGGSNDLYGFLVALMLNKTFYKSMFYYKPAKIWWEKVWVNETREKLERKLQIFHTETNPNNDMRICEAFPIVEVLKGMWLKCDVVEPLLDLLPNF